MCAAEQVSTRLVRRIRHQVARINIPLVKKHRVATIARLIQVAHLPHIRALSADFQGTWLHAEMIIQSRYRNVPGVENLAPRLDFAEPFRSLRQHVLLRLVEVLFNEFLEASVDDRVQLVSLVALCQDRSGIGVDIVLEFLDPLDQFCRPLRCRQKLSSLIVQVGRITRVSKSV